MRTGKGNQQEIVFVRQMGSDEIQDRDKSATKMGEGEQDGELFKQN